MYAIILAKVRDPQTTEDLVQETFLRVWTHIHAFDSRRGGLGAWVTAVARNGAIDYLRSARGRLANGSVDLDCVPHALVSASFENQAIEQAIENQRLRAVRLAFHLLRPNQRLVLKLAFEEGLTHLEIAERLRQPLGMVKTWVRTGLQLLRTEVA